MVNSPIQLAPLNVPFERRIQTATVALWLVSLPLTLFIFLISCTIIFLWPLIIPYLLFILFDIAPENGGRRFEFARRAKYWRYYADYYPIKLIKRVDLDPSKNYIFGYHPHGVISVGGWIAFATESTGFSKLFPNITCRMLTLTSNFNIPLYRDYLMAHGLASVSRQSCMNILKKGPGHSIMIVIGGAGESLSARPGVNDLILKRRMGFLKIAIVSGASLCPVFAFGETDIWDQADNPEGSALWKFQKFVQKSIGWTMPLFHGRGLFNYNFGILPHRRPIVTIVGKPIDVVQIDNPTEEDLLEVQKKYIAGLYEIWDQYKDVYAKNRKRELKLIE
ncbi:17615_t:CDS:2 [Dentiscutata erythropus]|uniref:Diacylglycerol O-acyltransferase n=1 Tax=Dentiscutata erythropus TaxID=1348616 RepID=A0A9N9DRD8_9GLOM|nr:17615_t:CDS:2 [Dentiscutata erythropus]